MSNRKSNGFTLAELLIVVAIIAILVAISIPIFGGYIEKSRESVDIANVRSVCSEVLYAAQMGKPITNVTESNGRYVANVPLKQEKEGWSTEGTINICGVSSTSDKKWLGEPTPGVQCQIRFTKTKGLIIDWSGGKAYEPATIANEERAKYEPALNAVLKTLFDSLVVDRLDDDNNHIAYVLFNSGKVTAVTCYKTASDTKGQGKSNLSAEDIASLNQKIATSLEDKGYIIARNEAGRIFFDWNGNVISGRDSNGKAIGIGGQNTNASIKLSADGGNKESASLKFKNDSTGWE